MDTNIALPRTSVNRQRILAVLVAVTVIGVLAFVLWPRTVTVYVHVGDTTVPVTVRGRLVADVIRSLQITLRDADVVEPGMLAPLREGMTIDIALARPVVVQVGRKRELHFTQAKTVGQLLDELGFQPSPQDVILVNGKPATPDATLPPPVWDETIGAVPWLKMARPISLRLVRPVPIQVVDGAARYTVWTTASTVGQALKAAGVTLYAGDKVRPSLGEPVSAGLRVFIQRSTPVIIQADGRVLQTRVKGRTVADALAELGIFLTGLDKVDPPLTTPLHENMRIRVTRVQEYIVAEDERIPFETVYVPDDNLEIDHLQVVTQGKPGILRRRYRVRVEDGKEVSRTLIDELVVQEPVNQVVAYGRKIVIRTLDTPEGPIQYWRRIRVFATSYSASTAGVDPSEPWYGITRLGLPMGRGIVAVDPRVIPLGTKVYVPGYGLGIAADTGGAIIGRRIDLGYDDWNLEYWRRWVDIYLLAPPPPPDQINYILPNWPRPPAD